MLIRPSFLLGVLVGSVLGIPDFWAWGSFAVGVCIAVVRLSLRKDGVGTVWRKVLWALPFILIGAGCGLLRINSALATPNQFSGWFGDKQDFEAVVVQEPDVREKTQLLTIKPKGYQQKLLATTTNYSGYEYGDLVWVRGKVEEAKEFDGFDYPGYLAEKGVYAVSRYPKIIVLKSGQGNVFFTWVYKFKSFLSSKAREYYSEPEASFVLGLVLGARRGLPAEITEQFAKTGTSHIMAVSGYNISILIGALAALAFVLGRKITGILSFVVIAIFVALVGFSGSVVRAAGMGYLVLVSMGARRLYYPLPAMAVVASLMALQSPRIVYWDVGFQLSVAATAGIVIAMPRLKPLWNTKLKAAMFGPALVTISATLATLPISIWRFGQFSLVGPLVNVLIAPAVPLSMGLGVLSFLPGVGPGFAFVNTYVLDYVLFVVKYFANQSFTVRTMSLSGEVVLAIYVGVWLLLLFFHRLRPKKKFGLNLPL